MECAIKLLILDVDGVMTNGTKAYDKQANVFGKCFHDHDFTAIKRFKQSMDVCFLSGDRVVNANMSKSRKIDFFHSSKGKDKSEYLQEICHKYEVLESEVAYVGDDIYDLEIMKRVKYPMCPLDAVWDVIEFCEANGYVIPCKGGEGVIKYLYREVQSWRQ